MKKFWLFVLAVVISFLPGLIGLIFSPSGASDLWYNALNKPFLTKKSALILVTFQINTKTTSDGRATRLPGLELI